MDQNPFKTKKFKTLFKKWNKKLVDSGHKEIENFKFDEPLLLGGGDNLRFRKVTPDMYETRTKYFANARALLNTYKFETTLHRKIWELHSEGYSLRDIEDEINDEYKRDTINFIIHKIRTNGMSG